MLRIQILALSSCAALALTPVVCGDERLDAPPIKIEGRLFSHEDEVKLGLPMVKGEHQVLYRATEDGYKFCHQQNLAVWKGKLFLMWSNGITHEDHNGQRILYCHTQDGSKWSQPAVLTEDHDGAGPLACVSAGWHDAGDTLVAYYTAIMEKRPGIDERNAMFYLTSKDGKTWSKPVKLAQGFFIEGPRRLPSGSLLMNGQWADRQPRLRFTDSSDGLSGWKDGKIPRVENVFTFPEPSWFVRANGTIVVIFRTKSGDPWIYASVSKDNGESWSRPVKTDFPDATARAFAGNLPDGTAFIISNPSRVPSKTHPSIGRRNPLTIALSNDGVLFDRAFVIRSEQTSMRFKGINKLDGWQYPTAVVWKNHLYVAYSINKEDEGVTRIALRDLQVGVSRKNGDRDTPLKVITEPNVKTDRLGGIDVPTATVLKKMHAGQYILHAQAGKLTEVPVQKVLLPHDGSANPQSIQLVKAPDGTVYVNLASLICKSTDGGLTWTSHAIGGPPGGIFEVLEDGTFVLLRAEGEHPKTQVVAKTSKDEGRTWQKIAEIPNPPGHWGSVLWIKRLKGETLLAGVGHINHVFERVDGRLQLKSGGGAQWTYQSRDGGRTWTRLAMIHDWASEGGITATPSGRLVAALRYQRPTMQGDPSDLEKRNGRISPGWPWKNVFLADSHDMGHTWQNFRQLTTVFGQTRGYPVALSDGTVVVIHDTRYGPGSPGSRAMISRDEGKTWQDEVYYLDFTTFTGSYNASVLLDDDVILTVAGSSQSGNSWQAVKDHTDFFAIRWKPKK